MKINSITAWLEKLPLTRPYTIAYKTITDTEIVFLEIRLENGLIGTGASNPFAEVVGESPSETLAHLRSGFLDCFIGKDIRIWNQLLDEAARHYQHLPGTLAAIDIALHDLFGQFLGIGVADIYGKKMDGLPTSVTIGIKDSAQMLEEARGYFDLGFRILKVKTGRDVEADIERVARLWESFSGKMIIRVDANQGYDLGGLEKFLQATRSMDIELIEQPLAAGADRALSNLPWEDRKQLVADESLLDASSSLSLAELPHRYGVFNIKLMKAGGIREAKDIALIARHAGISLFWGCNDESRVSISAALHAAYSCSNTRFLDLDGSFDLSKDLVEGGFLLREGCMYLSDQPGLGLTPQKG